MNLLPDMPRPYSASITGSWLPRLVVVLAVLAILACQGPADLKDAPRTPQAVKTAVETTPEQSHPAPLNALDTVKQRGELRVGMQVGYVPFQMHGPEGAVVGLDVDLAELVSRSLNVNLRIVSQTWQELIPSLLEGATDVVMSGMTVTPERNTQVMFTLPVMETGRMFLVHAANAERLRRIEDLDQPGIFVVSWPGSLGKIRLKETLPKAAHRQFADRKLALAEVLEKRAHALIDEEFSIRLACATYSEKLASGFKPVTYEQVAWAIRPNDPHWLNWLDNFIRTIQKDGRLDELKAKWLRDYFLDIRGQKGPR